MATIVRGIAAVRHLAHAVPSAIDGEPSPTPAAADELLGIGWYWRLGRGVLELASLMPEEPDSRWKRLAATGRLTRSPRFTDADPDQWRRLLGGRPCDGARRVSRAGGGTADQPAPRPCRARRILRRARHRALADLPLAERVRRLLDPETKRRMLAEHVEFSSPVLAYLATAFHKIFPLGDPPDYEPPAEASIAAIARRRGVTA